jgi:large subunit ribosomal protein L25
MDIIKLAASRRSEVGKGPSSRVRNRGQIPAIAYGPGHASVAVAVSPKALLDVLRSDHGQNSVVELDVEGAEKLTVMVRDYSYHPVTRALEHADFLMVKLDQPVEVDVPFRCTGKSKGVVLGGVLQQVFRRLPVRALPEHIPSHLDVDITELDINESLKVSQVPVPPGVKIRLPEEQTIVVVTAPETGGEEEKAAVPAGEKAPAAAGDKPAAGVAVPAKPGEKAPAAAPKPAEKKK